jgi:N-acyl-phosphatidylethanolamine-hydrolysing phospholipase D
VATWIGHSTFLIQIAGLSILTDPIFSDYCSPWPMRRLRRAFPPALAIPDLPPIDLILLSHCHYDHLDRLSLRQLGHSTPIACPLGLGAVLRRWGFEKVIEYGWGDQGELGDLKLCCLPVQHGAARTPFDHNMTLWCGWLLEIAGRKIFFAGDTGYAPYFPELFGRFAPVDLSLLPIGAYAPDWFMHPLHLNPAEAVQVHRDLGSRLSVAMHWGTFQLTDEPPGDPPAVLREALARHSTPESEFRVAGIGETVTCPAPQMLPIRK